LDRPYIAAPLSRKNILEIALVIREAIGLTPMDYFPVVKFLENVLPEIDEDFHLEIKDVGSMKEYGVAYPKDRKIVIREDVYLNAIKGVAMHRFTLAHEIGHYFLHRPERIGLARTNEEPKPFQKPEWQANTFAGELLAPSIAIAGMTVNEVMDKYGVSRKVAEIQMKFSGKAIK
jgi:Zn-dependent peptidase ImmA (M78 family)